jgi:hypothetical protein
MRERQFDHRGRAEELVAAITADADRDLQVTALAAVAEAALAVADELAGLRELLALKPPPGPSAPPVPPWEPGAPRVPPGVIGDPPWGQGEPPPGPWRAE